MSENKNPPKPDLEDLKKKALAATPGPWGEQRCPAVIDNHANVWSNFGIVAVTSLMPGSHAISNASYIAACSPDVILDLIERLEGMEEALKNIKTPSPEFEAIKFESWCECDESKAWLQIATERRHIARDALERFGIK